MVIRYLSQASLEEAVECMSSAFPAPGKSESLPLSKAVGRVTAEPLYAPYTVPGANLAAMDGIAAKSADTVRASDQHPVLLPSAVRLNTGNVVPREYDTLILIEDIWTDEDGGYWVRKPAGPMQHTRAKGEDVRNGGMVLPEGYRIRPFDVGALATYGIIRPKVRCAQAGLVPTGSELIEPGTPPVPGQVVESNTLMAAAFLEERGVTCTRYSRTPDDPDLIRAAIERAVAENDLVIVSAGSSAGTRDYTASVIADLGEVLIHGIAIKPGKPAIIGRIAGKPIVGMPGYPLSAQTILREVVSPLLTAWGFPLSGEQRLKVHLAQTLASEVGADEFVLHTTARVGDRYVAMPQSRGAGVQMAPIRANTIVRIPAQVEGYDAGESVDALLTTDLASVDATLLLTGSNDPALDLLKNFLMKESVRVVQANVGNRGGILAVGRDICHAAPLHLPGEVGESVADAVGAALPGTPVAVVTVAEMPIGLASKDGVSAENLAGVRFINRQRGSEMRAFIEKFLHKQGIDPAAMDGMEREAQSHRAVAAAVRDGEVDAGITTRAAASSCGLTFEEIGTEHFVLVIREEHLKDPRVAALVRTVNDEAFAGALEEAGDYDTAMAGTVVYINAEESRLR